MTTLYKLQTPDGNHIDAIGEEEAQAQYDYLTDKWDTVRVYRAGELFDVTRGFESDE